MPAGCAMIEFPVSPQYIDSYIRIGAQGGGNRDLSGKSGLNLNSPVFIFVSDFSVAASLFFHAALRSVGLHVVLLSGGLLAVHFHAVHFHAVHHARGLF